MAGNELILAEMQGLYGPFSLTEKQVQRIWFLREFDRAAARTEEGREVHIEFPGRWNHGPGPDFLGALLRIDGREVEGDVEVHLQEADWRAHGHSQDSAYGKVVLHVVLFPPRERVTEGVGKQKLPVLSLLPILLRDLEDYAADAVVEKLAAHPLAGAQAILARQDATVLRDELKAQARRRWQAKVQRYRRAIQACGWVEACHQAALEILGYSQNRAPMVAMAQQHGLSVWETWSQMGMDFPGLLVFEDDYGWRAGAVRPANSPLYRLRQYEAWVRTVAHWPKALRAWEERLPTVAHPGEAWGRWREEVGLTRLREDLRERVVGKALNGPRLDNLVADGFLPLLAAEGRRPETLEALWTGWFLGDAPAPLAPLLRGLGIFGGRQSPAAHGPCQGLLGWLAQREGVFCGAGFGAESDGPSALAGGR